MSLGPAIPAAPQRRMASPGAAGRPPKGPHPVDGRPTTPDSPCAAVEPPVIGGPRLAVAVIACGALAADVRRVCRAHGLDVDVHPVPALLHNRPERIADTVQAELERLGERYERVAVAYADCGTYGALDAVLERSGVPRLAGEHCYDVLAHAEVRALLEEEPGTYLLTDFLARTFAHTVVRELGLDRHPELRDDYFGHYRRVVWLAQRPTPATRRAAERAAAAIGLPLEVRTVRDEALTEQLLALVALAPAAQTGISAP